MAEQMLSNMSTATLSGVVFFVPVAGNTSCEENMANQLENVTRRNFLSGTAGALAASGAALVSPVEAKPAELEQMARALHQTVGRYSDQNAPFFSQPPLPPCNPSLDFAMENLRYWSVDEIQHLLKPLFEGGTS